MGDGKKFGRRARFLLFFSCVVLTFSTNALEISDQGHLSSLTEVNAQTKIKTVFESSHRAKTGAAVSFSHNYAGSVEKGEQRLVRLNFSERYATGQLSIYLQPEGGLVIQPAIQHYDFKMDSRDPIYIDVILSAEERGKYYLNIFVSVSGGIQQSMSRVFALAFYVGQTPPSDHKKQQEKTGKQSELNDGVILVPVVETF